LVFLDCPAAPPAAILQTVQEIRLEKYLLEPTGMENQLKKPIPDKKMKKMVTAKMDILEENLGIKKCGKKVVGKFD
jgi:hypothetical protein